MKDVVRCDKLVGRREQPLIPRFPNGETHLQKLEIDCRVTGMRFLASGKRYLILNT